MSDDDDDDSPFADAIESSLFDEEPPEPAPEPAPETGTETGTEPAAAEWRAWSGLEPGLEPGLSDSHGPEGSRTPPLAEGAAEEPSVAGPSAAVASAVRTAVAAGAGAVWRGVRGSGATEVHDGYAPEEGTISTSEVPALDGGGQPWTLVELKQSGAQARLSARWAAKAHSFHALDSWERQRCVEHKRTAAQHLHVLELLQRQSSAGREEQLECVTFLQQRAQADAQYASSITKQRLGRRPVAELSDLRSTLMAAKAEGKGEGGAAGAAASAALIDASGVVAVSGVMSVLGCMMLQAGDRIHKFAESDSLQKDLAASHVTYAAAVDKIVSSLAAVLDELRRLDRACVDAFSAHRAAFAELQRSDAAAQAEAPPADLWLTEFLYRSSLLAFAERAWLAGGAVRDALERFRAAEHRRLATLHGSLRVFVSLQQRLWADISASTSAVHGIFKELPGATGLSEQPASIALERLTATAAQAEYAAPPPPPPSLLVVHEGRLSYQRAMLRTWVSVYAVLTHDLFLHCFSCAPADEPHSATLRAEQRLFSVRCAAGTCTLGSSEHHAFEVTTSSASGLLGKVGLSAASSQLQLRAESAEALDAWIQGLRPRGEQGRPDEGADGEDQDGGAAAGGSAPVRSAES